MKNQNKPECFIPNDFAYPLCIGNGNRKCKSCNPYVDMVEGEEGDLIIKNLKNFLRGVEKRLKKLSELNEQTKDGNNRHLIPQIEKEIDLIELQLSTILKSIRS